LFTESDSYTKNKTGRLQKLSHIFEELWCYKDGFYFRRSED